MIGKMVWREEGHFQRRVYREYPVVGETTRSWIVKCGWSEEKMPKSEKLRAERGWFLSAEEVERHSWVKVNRVKISNAIGWGKHDYETLKAVAALIGYEH